MTRVASCKNEQVTSFMNDTRVTSFVNGTRARYGTSIKVELRRVLNLIGWGDDEDLSSKSR